MSFRFGVVVFLFLWISIRDKEMWEAPPKSLSPGGVPSGRSPDPKVLPPWGGTSTLPDLDVSHEHVTWLGRCLFWDWRLVC